MLKQRIITAIVMVLLIGAGVILLPATGVALMFGLLVLIAAWEWSALAGISAMPARFLFLALTVLLMAAVATYTHLLTGSLLLEPTRDVIGLGCLWWAVALLWVRSYPASAVIWRSVFVRCVMGLLTLVPAWLGLVYLRFHSEGVVLIFVLVALVASADIGAYFAGRAWGKAKLAVNVSPGKSWAGFWGGLAASMLLACVLWWFLDDARHPLLPVLAIAMATSLASVLGDLLESMVKRQQGVKDSGRILPGHGGMMDRLDSMTAAAPVFALSLILAGW